MQTLYQDTWLDIDHWNAVMYFLPFVLQDELYGDFEDLETGEAHKAKTGNKDKAEVYKSNQFLKHYHVICIWQILVVLFIYCLFVI